MSEPTAAQTPGSPSASSAAFPSTMEVTVVSADRPIWSGRARSVTIPGVQGSMGILPNHEPILSLLKRGGMMVVGAEGTRRSFDVDDGFAAFDSNRLTVAVEHCSVGQQ